MRVVCRVCVCVCECMSCACASRMQVQCARAGASAAFRVCGEHANELRFTLHRSRWLLVVGRWVDGWVVSLSILLQPHRPTISNTERNFTCVCICVQYNVWKLGKTSALFIMAIYNTLATMTHNRADET